MNMKKMALSAALAATMCGAALAATQQMASKTLVEKRIAETTTNLTGKIAALRSEILELIAARKQASSNETSAAAKNFAVSTLLFAEELKNNKWADCPYVGDYVYEATDSRYDKTYLVSDKKSRVEDGWTVYWATNAYVGICSYEKVKIAGGTTNFLPYILTPDGERYDRVYVKAQSRTFACTTNDQRKIVLQYRRLPEEAFRIIMGIDETK